MPYIYVKDFATGLDSRRMEVNTPGGALLELRDAHISRGGEVESRKRFVPEYEVAGTVGLAQIPTAVVVFGTGEQPADIPAGVVYQRLNAATSATLERILSWDLYDSKLYVVAEFNDNSIHHFYDGAEVTDWYNGRASTTVNFTGGHQANTAKGSFLIVGGSDSPGANMVANVQVDGINLLSTLVDWQTSNADTASAVATQINVDGIQDFYTATAQGNKVIIQAVDTGTAPNGRDVTVGVLGDVVVSQETPLAGGVVGSSVFSILINGVEILGAIVPFPDGGTLQDYVQDIADRINAQPSTPEYEATADVNNLLIRPALVGAVYNGYQVFITAADTFWTPTVPVLAGGADSGLQPGTYVKTIKTKVYSTSGSNLHFSGVDAPTKWTSDVTGAGLINMAKQASGSEDLLAMATYQNNAAIFSARTIQLWFLDIDPAQSQQVQVLKNTGTTAPLSVVTFGDRDVFYLDDSGVRSLQARDSSNAAFSSDIGNPVDTLIQSARAVLPADWRDKAIGLIEPEDGRFWLIMKTTIFVFSYFTNSKISAWSTYETGFNVDYAVVFNRRVYLRTGQTIYVYGGLDGDNYSAVSPIVGLPFLDAGKPGNRKKLIGLDASCDGEWNVYCGTDPIVTNPGYFDLLATIPYTTFNSENIGAVGEGSHFALRFVGKPGDARLRLGSVLIHYLDEGSEANG